MLYKSATQLVLKNVFTARNQSYFLSITLCS